MRNSNFDLGDVYIERCIKETDEGIAVESRNFLKQSLQYLEKHKNEYIYLEAKSFEELGVDGVCLEVDDVFRTYDVILGLKLQKKYGTALKNILHTKLQGNETTFDLMFNQADGLWDLNFGLNFVEGFQNELPLEKAFQLIFQFLEELIEEVEVSK
ncbi:hypothetical protein [Calidifontibacillus oryziterrae]|uniref:hypothetical protein n=1 Tax=Calidifontibacillus oryziterrae TaxID=1191699 RepID=UPI00030CCB03|nr:hypothetical protein [Calidifontibacillus oryziterrae]